jgi:hypothetical protein
MQLDFADVSSLEQNGDLLDVALHEMAHVLGVGTLWGNFETLLINPSLPSSPGADTHFSGSRAVAAFDAAGGTAYTGGAKVPVDNGADVGSSDAHWREAVLLLELMTPELTPGIGNPLSAITTGSLADLGYSVNSSAADPFTGAFPAPARSPDAGKRMTAPGRPRAPGPRVIDMGNDAYRGLIEVVDRSGRVVRTMIRR